MIPVSAILTIPRDGKLQRFVFIPEATRRALHWKER